MANTGYLVIGGPLAGEYRSEQGTHFTAFCEPCTLSDALSGKTTRETVTYKLTVIAVIDFKEVYAWLPIGMTDAQALELLMETYSRYEDLK